MNKLQTTAVWARSSASATAYVTPAPSVAIADPVEWFIQVVETEIGPLLDEYWFDSLERAAAAESELLDGL